MPKLSVTMRVPDPALARETADKLRGFRSTVERDLLTKLMEEMLHRRLVTFVQIPDPLRGETLVSASIVVGEEHVVTYPTEYQWQQQPKLDNRR